FFFFFQAEDGIRDFHVTGVQTCALPICTSTPTSITVVATSTDSSPAEKRAITSAFSAGDKRPCRRPTPCPCTTLANSSWVCVTRSEERRVGNGCSSRRRRYQDENI